MKTDQYEMLSFLQEYIRIKTALPTPDYEAVGTLFSRQAQRDGFIFTRYQLPSGYPCFVITARGENSTLPSLVLNHHMDVVPAVEGDRWSVDPFAGTIVGDKLIGRGTQDTKGLGAIHYFALRACAQKQKLKRTVHLLLVPDEECGGFKGTGQLIEQPFFKELNVGFVFDEGPSSGVADELLVKIDERRPLQIRITATGTAGHGSHLYIDNALHRLSRITAALVLYQESQRKNAEPNNPGTSTSCNITHIRSTNENAAHNVVPHCAEAYVDIRIAPCDTRHKIETFIANLCLQEGAAYTVVAAVPERTNSLHQTDFLLNTVTTISQRHGMQCRAIVSEGASDLRFYWERGIAGIGFAPFTSSYNAHGINEALTIAELLKAKEIMQDSIHALTTMKD